MSRSTPSGWTDLQARGGELYFTPEQLEYLATDESQIAAGEALREVRRLIDSIPEEQAVLGFTLSIIVKEGDAARTRSLLYGPAMALANVCTQLRDQALEQGALP
jgi:hypothetical protein